MRAVLRNVENLFRGRDPQPELPWQWTDWLGLTLLALAAFAAVVFLVPAT